MKRIRFFILYILLVVSISGCDAENEEQKKVAFEHVNSNGESTSAITKNKKMLSRILNNVQKPQILFWEYSNEDTGIKVEFHYDEHYEVGGGILYEGENTSGTSFTFNDCMIKGWEETEPYSVRSMQDYVIQNVTDEVADYKEIVEYDEEGKIKSFKAQGTYEEMRDAQLSPTLVEIDFEYRENGRLWRKNYKHNAWLFGTSCSPWTAYYDERERLVYEQYYLTHGGMEIFYTYEDDNEMPEYCLRLDRCLNEVYVEFIEYEQGCFQKSEEQCMYINSYIKEIPADYEMYPNRKDCFVISEYRCGSYTDTICRANEQGTVEKLREWTIDFDHSYQIIRDCDSGSVLYEGEAVLNPEGRLTDREDYADIFWSELSETEKGQIYGRAVVTSEDYVVYLQDLIPDKSLKLVVAKGEKESIVQVLEKGYDYVEAEQLSIEAFSNVLGCNGFSIHNYWDDRDYLIDYYAIENGKLMELASSWRHASSYFSESDECDARDHFVDVNGDGIRELICNVMYLADGAQHTYVYYYNGDAFFTGDGVDLLAEDYDNRGTGSTLETYLPDKNVIRIGFWKEELGEYDYREYAIDLNKMEMELYEPVLNGL